MNYYDKESREIDSYVKSQPIKTQKLFSYICSLNNEILTRREYQTRINDYVKYLKEINI